LSRQPRLYIPAGLSEKVRRKMKNLPFQDQRHFDSAEGWLGLGDHLAANGELEQITPEFRADPRVLEVRLQIYWAAK
jgi:hypothetical protein